MPRREGVWEGKIKKNKLHTCTDAGVWWRIIAHKHRIRCWTSECVVWRQPTVITWWWLIRWWWSFMPGSRRCVWWWIIEIAIGTPHVLLGNRGCTQHSLTILYSPTRLKVQLELHFTDEITIGLGTDLAFDIVGTENRLLNVDLNEVRNLLSLWWPYSPLTYITHCNEWSTKGQHRLGLLLAVENHSMRRQINVSILGTLEDGTVLPSKLQTDIFTVNEYAAKKASGNLLVPTVTAFEFNLITSSKHAKITEN